MCQYFDALSQFSLCHHCKQRKVYSNIFFMLFLFRLFVKNINDKD